MYFVRLNKTVGRLQMQMMKVSLLSLIFLTGCASFPNFGGPEPLPPLPPVQVVTTEVKLDIYQPPLPQEIRMENVRWYVITAGNMEEKIAEIEGDLGGDFVVFAMTPQGYENMAYNMQELRRYILQQKEIILYYREATKSDEGTTSEDWLQNNDELAEQQRRQNFSENGS